jgi:IMP dehydrogenase/GMP reductase
VGVPAGVSVGVGVGVGVEVSVGVLVAAGDLAEVSAALAVDQAAVAGRAGDFNPLSSL